MCAGEECGARVQEGGADEIGGGVKGREDDEGGRGQERETELKVVSHEPYERYVSGWGKAYCNRSAGLCRARLMQPLRCGTRPFCRFFALLFVLLQARYVLVGEVEAVGAEGGGQA